MTGAENFLNAPCMPAPVRSEFKLQLDIVLISPSPTKARPKRLAAAPHHNPYVARAIQPVLPARHGCPAKIVRATYDVVRAAHAT